jgi:hypothetical protein
MNTKYCSRAKQIKYASFIQDTLSPLIKKILPKFSLSLSLSLSADLASLCALSPLSQPKALASLSHFPFLSPSQLLSSENPELRQAATLCSRSQLRQRFFLFESQSSLSSTVFSKKSMGLGLDFSAGFVAAVLVLKVVMGLGFVAAGAAKELVVVVL